MKSFSLTRGKCFPRTCVQSHKGAHPSTVCRQAFRELPLPGVLSKTCDGFCPEGMGEVRWPSLGLGEVRLCPPSSQEDWTPVQGPSLISGQYCPQMFSTRDWRPLPCQKGISDSQSSVAQQSLSAHLRCVNGQPVLGHAFLYPSRSVCEVLGSRT